MNLGVIGSRTFNDYLKLEKSINELLKGRDITKIISGGAKGADSLAEVFANKYNIPIEIHKPNWKKFGKKAGVLRNIVIVNDSDIIIAFWDEKSKGTLSSINLAYQQFKEIHIIKF